MPMKGNITNLLKLEYREKGYALEEDEDFVYLYVPGDEKPHVSSIHSATIESVEAFISKTEAGK